MDAALAQRADSGTYYPGSKFYPAAAAAAGFNSLNFYLFNVLLIFILFVLPACMFFASCACSVHGVQKRASLLWKWNLEFRCL